MVESITEWKQKSVRTHKRKVFTVDWNLEGKRLASGSVDQTIRITRVDDQTNVKQEAELRGASDTVTSLKWSPTHPDKLASICNQEKSLRFWDIRTSKNSATISTPGYSLFMAWSPDGHHVAVSSKDDVIGIVDTRKMKVVHKYAYNCQVNELSFGKDSKQLLLCAGSEVEILDFPELRKRHVLSGHTSFVVSVAADKQHKYIATGGGDAVACLWDTQDYICQRTYIGMDHPIRCLEFSHDSQYLAILGEQPIVDIELTESGQGLGRLPLTQFAEDLSWHPRRHMLAICGAHGSDYGDILFCWRP